MKDSIEKEIIINAPVSVVWDVITKPEHVSKWYSNSAEIELKPGGKGLLKWDKFGESPLEIVSVDEPHEFSFLWVTPAPETMGTGAQTLVKFNLFEDEGRTKLRLTESGYDNLELPEDKKTSLYERHNGSGWTDILNGLQKYISTLEK